MSELGPRYFDQSVAPDDPFAPGPVRPDLNPPVQAELSTGLSLRDRNLLYFYLAVSAMGAASAGAAVLAVVGGTGSTPNLAESHRSLVGVHFRSEQLVSGEYDLGIVVGLGEVTFGQRLLWDGQYLRLRPAGTVVSFAGKSIYDPAGLMQE